jgi:hypothetical protein
MARGAPGGNSSKLQVIVNGHSEELLEQLFTLPFIRYMKFLRTIQPSNFEQFTR